MRTTIFPVCVLLSALTGRISPSFAQPSGPVRALACAPSNPAVAAAVVNTALWVTDTRGAAWRPAARLANGIQAKHRHDESADNEFPTSDPRLDSSVNPTVMEPNDSPVPLRENGMPEIILAIGDADFYAISHETGLLIGQWTTGLRKQVQLPHILGLAFDDARGLWVTTTRAVFFYELNSQYPGSLRIQRFPIHAAGAPVFDVGGHRILIPSRTGLWIGSSDKGIPVVYQISPYPMTAVAPSGKQDTYIIVIKDKLEILDATTGVRTSVGATPPQTTRLLRESKGTIWYYSPLNGWNIKKGQFSSFAAGTVVALDARGDLWLGTSTGILIPSRKRALTGDSAPFHFKSFPIREPVSYPLFHVKPPPCPSLFIAPIPVVRFSIGWGTRYHSVPTGSPFHDPDSYPSRRLAVGLVLTWSLRGRSRYECFEPQLRYQRYLQQRSARVEYVQTQTSPLIPYPSDLEPDLQHLLMDLGNKQTETLLQLYGKETTW